ncbi:hypothetical protein [Bifidobacterium thermophilum]|uniref:Uncharacterized protein n=1 Tax=Bifidobacterium thermophilum TaxID=33905 RepID=A0A7X9RLC7_9BIFI|nr:hypothetical protein [Bifidobacterium thermophilum]NME62493.1 hypothetical protein [Bifidobacterium thermophilum]
MGVCLEINCIPQEEAKRIKDYLFAHSSEWIAEPTDRPIGVESIGGGKAFVTFPAIAEVDLREFMLMLGDE